LTKNAEKAQEAQCDFLGFIVRKRLPELVLVDGFELIDGLAAKLLRWVHARDFTLNAKMEKDGRIAAHDIFGITDGGRRWLGHAHRKPRRRLVDMGEEFGTKFIGEDGRYGQMTK
jgi:hypothetical protein